MQLRTTCVLSICLCSYTSENHSLLQLLLTALSRSNVTLFLQSFPLPYTSINFLWQVRWPHGYLQCSTLNSGLSCLGLSPGLGHCVVFFGKTCYSHSASPQLYKWVLTNLMLGATLWWTSIPSKGSRNTPSHFK